MREIDDMGELIKEWHDKANHLVHLSQPLENGEDIEEQLQQVKVWFFVTIFYFITTVYAATCAKNDILQALNYCYWYYWLITKMRL